MSARRKTFVLALTLAASACGREEATNTRSAAGSSDATDGGSKTGNGSTSGSTSGENPANTGSSSGSSSDTSQPPAPGQTGKEYYNATVYKVFDAACTKCHADPRQNPDIRGPLTIFSYPAMKKMLDGDSAAESTLMKKVRNLTAHSGGDRCASGPKTSPCLEISEWWGLENGEDSGLAGELTAVSLAGEVTGYAVNVNDLSEALTIDFVADGATVLTLTADQTAYDGGYDGAHAFKGTLPPALRNGSAHDLTAQVTLGGKQLSVGKAVHFAAYTPKDAGKTYFINTVAPAMGGCTGCHAVTYETMYASLINKAPFLGGTAADNELVNRASASVAHPGGNLCGSKTGSPCNLFQTWWGLEFK